MINQEKKKILHLIESLNMGGAQKIIYQLAASANNAGYEHSICSILQSGPYEKIMRNEGINLTVLNSKRRSIILFPLFVYDLILLFSRLVKLVNKNQVDVLHAHLPDSSLIAIVVGWLTNTPVVLTVHNNFALPSQRKAPIRDAVRTTITNWVFKRANHIITVGGDIKESLLKILGDSVPISTVYNGVDYALYSGPVKSTPKQLRQSLGVNANTKIIVTVARLDAQKGHVYLIDAISQLTLKHPDAVFILIGDGALKKQLIQQALRQNVSDSILFLGNRDDVPEILAVSDLFVLPSLYEGVPLVVLEAMAAGLPVIATDIAGTRELINTGIDGLLTQVTDPTDLARAIDSLLSDAERGKEMSMLARTKVQERFTLQQMISGTERVYQEVLNGN